MPLRWERSFKVMLAALLMLSVWAAHRGAESVSASPMGGTNFAAAMFSPSEVAVGEPTTLRVYFNAEMGEGGNFTGRIDFPPAATVVSSSKSCENSTATVEPGRGISFSGSVVAGSECTFDFVMTFSAAGNYPQSWPSAADWDRPYTSYIYWLSYLTVSAPVSFCDLTPDLAVSPQFITLEAGGRATVDVVMRNRCNDTGTVPGDLLVSFSDGLSVVATQGGLVADGQRAAVRAFALDGGETRRWSVTVEAAAVLPADPRHVTEHYVGGRVVNRINGVFLVPEATSVAVVEVAAAPAAATPVAAVSPATLPNTAGELSGGAADVLPLLVLPLLVLLMVAARLAARPRR